MSMDLDPIGYDGYGSPLYAHQRTMFECGDCLSLYVSANAARSCCSLEWIGKGWD